MPDHLQALVPGGTLRAAINFGNPILAHRDPATQQPTGVSVDLARELARRLGVGLALLTFEAAGKVVEALKADQVDVAFVAIDPLRGQDVAYTAPYVLIEGAYLVRQDSPIRVNEEVDRPGVRVAVAPGSAYDLFLRRTLKQATLSNAPGSNAVVDHFLQETLRWRPVSVSRWRLPPASTPACVCSTVASWRSNRPWARRGCAVRPASAI